MKNPIDTLLEFEEKNPELLDFRFKFDDILIWPHLLRRQIFGLIVSNYNPSIDEKSLNQSNTNCFSDKTFENYRKTTNLLSPFNNSKELSKFDIIIMTSARWKQKINGKYINPLSDYFALEFSEKTLIIEDSYRNEYSYPKYFDNLNYIARDSIDLLVTEKANDSSIHPKDIYSIENIVELLKSDLPFNICDSIYTNLKKVLFNISIKLQFYYTYYNLLIDKVNPKLFFLHGASYTSKGYLVKWLKKRGITVGEFQHGSLNSSLPAYNYPESTYNNKEYLQYLPDYLLTFGQHWNNNIRHPAQKVSIGNPHLNKKVQNAVNKRVPNQSTKRILIVSKPNLTKEFVELTRNLANIVSNNYVIVHRIHPVERIFFKEHYHEFYNIENVQISDSGDIYDLICEVDYVVGCNSTVLYEAIAFSKPVYVYGLPNIFRIEIGIEFFSVADLYKLIQNHNHKQVCNPDYYWELSWQKKYSEFINSIFTNYPPLSG